MLAVDSARNRQVPGLEFLITCRPTSPLIHSNNLAKNDAVVSWTSGKDGCYSCYKAMNDGYRITHLLHFTNQKKIGSHELNPALIRAQAQAPGLPHLQRDFRT
ncbi:MAG: hypothetical protein NTX42_02150 [Methanothrix sp.]|nr:hypothetical protein [Methanothrix sp.]